MLGLGNSLATSGGVQGLIPTDISGLQLHCKFNTGISGASNTTAAGNMSDDEVIHTWTDQTGNQDARQTNDAHRPNWEDATTDISFNGDNDHFDLASDISISANQDFTIIVRFKFTDFAAAYALVGHSSQNVLKVPGNTSISTLIGGAGGNVFEESSDTLAADVYYIFTLVRSGGSDGDLKAYVHGGAYSDKSWDDAESHQDADALTIGTIGSANDTALNPLGFMRDVIIYKGTALNASQRADIYSYINGQ
tara:strand:+ start:287 stop:1039 length:753 start_codon:yes stop_codon:yes gene_type:complete